MTTKKNTLLIGAGVVLVLLLIGVTVMLISEKKTNYELVQEFQLEKKTWKTNTPGLPNNTTN